MWSDNLIADGFPVVRFDAFENDYIEDPFLAISGEIIELAERLRPEDPDIDKIRRAASSVGKIILQNSVNAAVRVLTVGAVDLLEVSSDISGAIGEAAGNL